jgi:beta-galactosidase
MGVLPHSQRPGRIYREVQALGTTLRQLGPLVSDMVPDADVLLLTSSESRWAFEFYPPLAAEDETPDSASYERILRATYRGLFEAGVQVRIASTDQFLALEPGELVERYPVLVAAAVYVADDALLTRLRDYAEAGGHLVLGVRTGYADELARARQDVAPAILSDSAGAWYDEFSNLRTPLPIRPGGALDLDESAAGLHWVDALQFAESELEARAAVVTHRAGAGRVTTLATVPNPALSRGLAAWLVPHTAAGRWQAPREVSVSTGRGSGAPLTFVSNWSGLPASVVAPSPVRNIETGEHHAAGAQILLEPRGAAVFQDTDHSAE